MEALAAHVVANTSSSSAGPAVGPAEPDSLEQLLGDCRRMAERWKPAVKAPVAVASAGPRGISVPPASAHVVHGMAEYGD